MEKVQDLSESEQLDEEMQELIFDITVAFLQMQSPQLLPEHVEVSH
jgi:hypothetical protein